ncbi:MAG TPA: hypothetical protein VK034_12165 [Enhygromyxa sp.]|nr:hypothetical protein [Enhygromyxa sp.]
MAPETDPEAREFFSAHVESTALTDALESLIPPHRSMAIQCVIEHRTFRRLPGRLSTLASTVARFERVVGHELAERGLSGFRHEVALSETLLRIVRYSANLYAWQDHPDIRPEQRGLLREELILPVVLDIIRQDLVDPPQVRAPTSLVELSQRMIEVTRELTKKRALKKVRGDVVLKWCRVNIMRTTQRYLGENGEPCLDSRWVEALANVKVRAVVFNILVDELADDVQDRALFEVFRQIPFDADGRIGALTPARERELRAQVPVLWRDYFDLAAATWSSVIHALLSVVGPQAYDEHAEQLAEDYRMILAAMEYALELNSTPSFAGLMRSDGGELLAYNMNMMAFETFDRMALRQANPSLDARLREQPGLYRQLRELNVLLQHNGQIGNSTTTIDAEIDENCIANEIVQLAARSVGPSLCELFITRKQALAESDFETYAELGAQLRNLIRNTGALAGCFERWMINRREVLERLRDSAVLEVVDTSAWLSAHDMLLVTSWVYGGDI